MNRVSRVIKLLFQELEVLRYAAIAIAGHKFWLIPIIVPIVWLAPQSGMEILDWITIRDEGIQFRLAVPLAFVGLFLGLRIIASEINARTLEIVYTVPGGAERVWWIKILASLMILLMTEAVMGVYAWFLITPYNLESLYGALQVGVFYMAVAMGFSTLFRSEVAGAIVAVVLLGLNLVLTEFGREQHWLSPIYNPHAINDQVLKAIVVETLRNRIFIALVTIMIFSLAFLRGNRREKLLSG